MSRISFIEETYKGPQQQESVRFSSRTRFRRRHDGVSRVHKGNAHIEPLLGLPRTRKSSPEFGRRPRSRSRSRTKRAAQAKVVDPSMAFGEIGFLKNKLGFTLPSAEAAVKSASLVRRPKGKLLRIDDMSARFTRCLEEAGLIYVKLSQSGLDHRKSRVHPYLRSYSAPVKLTYTPPNERQKQSASFSKSSEFMARNRAREKSNLELLLRNLERSLHRARKKKDRAILPRLDGSFVVYTKEELDKFYAIDEETLKTVKRRLALDRRKALEEVDTSILSESLKSR